MRPSRMRPARLVAGVDAAPPRRTSGRLADEVALLVLRDDRWRAAPVTRAGPGCGGVRTRDGAGVVYPAAAYVS
ncbi:hypothetical protein ACWD0G_20920, partial [Streptomyces goshikiensis]